MSHMHIPDGVLPIWLIVLGWLLTGALLALVTLRLKKDDSTRHLPLLGVMSAVMLVGMSVEFVPIAYHTNLSVLAGIVLGPALGFLAALIVNLLLALFGHGGITVVGLNVPVLWAETALGFYFFRLAWSLSKRSERSPAIAAGVGTAVALLLGTLLMVGIVGLSNLEPDSRVASALGDLSLKSPLEHGLFSVELIGGEEELAEASRVAAERMDVVTFAKLVLLLGSLGWVMEALLTGAIVGFVHRVRPDLVLAQRTATLSSGERRPANEHGRQAPDEGGSQPPLKQAE